jgi:hypothetical protein
MPFFLEAAILSRIRSPVTSRSNWANDKSTFRVSRPIEVRIEGLRHRDEGHSMCIEHLDDLGKVEQRAGKPIDFVHHDNIHF